MTTTPSVLPALVLSALGSAISAQAQTAPAVQSDVYHVNVSKAVPGSAAALATALTTPDPKAPSPGRFVVLRHQQGDDWDFCVIEHLGTKTTVDAAPAAPGSRADGFFHGAPVRDLPSRYAGGSHRPEVAARGTFWKEGR